jgi:GPH family glycoside/pentoside/hexuronide:cation symporter
MVVGFYSAALAVTIKIIVPMLEHGLQLGTIELISVAGIFIIGILVLLYVWAYFVKRLGKRRTLTLGLAILATILPFTAVIGLPILGPALIQLVVWAIPFAAAMAVIYMMRYVVLADIAQKDEIDSGEGRAGVYEGFQGVPLNIFQAVGVALLGWILLVLQVSPPPDPVNFGFFWWGPIYAIFVVISIIILQFTDIDPEFSELEKASAIK